MSRGILFFLLLILASILLLSENTNKITNSSTNSNTITEYQPATTSNLQVERSNIKPKTHRAKTVFSPTVYICKGPNSKRYHYKKNCRGLKSCSTKVYEVSSKEAKDLGRTLCGWED